MKHNLLSVGVLLSAAVLMMTNVTTITAWGAEADGFTQVTMEEAKALWEEENEDQLILDVRTPEEYAAGHIPGAVNVPNEIIRDTEPKELPDKEARIYVYCRSGRRSKDAAKKLADMGYTNVVEIGGIQDWQGEIVSDASLVYTFGDGFGMTVDENAVSISILDEETVCLTARNGGLIECVTVPAEKIQELTALVEETVNHLQEDMSDACVADGGYAFLYVAGKSYGGHAVQNASFARIGRAFRELAGKERIDAFKEQLKQ